MMDDVAAAGRPTLDTESLDSDVVVIGGSLAGLRAAIAAAEAGARVVLLCRGTAGSSGSAVVASNDLAGVLPECEDDSSGTFLADLTTSGHGIADPALAAVLAEEAGLRIRELSRFGIGLLATAGRPDLVRVPGHSRARGVRVEPLPNRPPGLALTLPLRQVAERLGVRILNRCPTIELWCDAGEVRGAFGVDLSRRVPLAVAADSVVLATGGGAYLYLRTNAPNDVAGEGYALAARVGAELRDMEFVQFHSTRMDEPIRRMLTEGLMDDGAVLRNRDGESFMSRYHPEGTMAPRDIRCRAIYEEIQSGRGVDGYVYLDCSTVPADRLRLRHAALAEQLRAAGVDFPREPLRVSPAAHFFMGGVAIDTSGGTTVPGLYACGEVAGGVHGANRLGSTAYSEALVFGARAGAAAAVRARGQAAARRRRGTVPRFTVSRAGSATGGEPRWAELRQLRWAELRQLMWDHVGVRRSAAGLACAQAKLAELRGVLPGASVGWHEIARAAAFELALLSSEAVTRAALERQESRGAHWRVDFPETFPGFRGSTYLRLREDTWSSRFEPVETGTGWSASRARAVRGPVGDSASSGQPAAAHQPNRRV
jgi:aspartate oxidase